MQNYDLLVDRVAKASGLEKEEIERRVEARRAKLSNLISKEGAAQIIAAELGVSFDNVDLKVSELVAGMKKANVVGKILNVFQVREYTRNGKPGKVASFVIGDDTGSVRVVLWDLNHIALIEKKDLAEEDVVEIKNAAMRESELHLSGFSELKKSKQVIENVKRTVAAEEREIAQLQQGMQTSVRGTVVQIFNPRFFFVCGQCGKKANQTGEGYLCDVHGRVEAKERAILSLVVDDGTETVRAVLFSEQISKIVPEEDLKDLEKFSAFRDELLGTELDIRGLVKKNQLFGNLEVNVSDISRVKVDELVAKLEAKK